MIGSSSVLARISFEIGLRPDGFVREMHALDELLQRRLGKYLAADLHAFR